MTRAALRRDTPGKLTPEPAGGLASALNRSLGHSVSPRSRLTVLLTGFGPFPGAHFNPTGALVAKLLKLRAPAFADVKLVGHVFRTAYEAVDEELPRLLDQHKPDVLLMFGLAASTRHVRLEACARDACTALLSDASGRLQSRRNIGEGGGTGRMRPRLPLAALLRAARMSGLPTRVSQNAGRYLCNYLYWRAAELAACGRPKVFIFIHVPNLAQGRRPASRRAQPRIDLDDLVRGLGAVLRVLIAAAKRREP